MLNDPANLIHTLYCRCDAFPLFWFSISQSSFLCLLLCLQLTSSLIQCLAVFLCLQLTFLIAVFFHEPAPLSSTSFLTLDSVAAPQAGNKAPVSNSSHKCEIHHTGENTVDEEHEVHDEGRITKKRFTQPNTNAFCLLCTSQCFFTAIACASVLFKRVA